MGRRVPPLLGLLLLALLTCSSGERAAPGGERAPVSPPAASAGEPPPVATAAPAKAGPLCLHLEPSRPKALLGEPVLLIAGLENCSDRPLAVSSPLAAEYGFLTVAARAPGSEREVPYYPPARREGRGASDVTLAPGELLLEDVAIYLARDGWFLPEPGEYRFRARYATEAGEVSSNPARLEVEAPPAGAGRAAAGSWISTDAGRAFYLGRRKDAGATDLARIAELYGGTSWGAFARVALAETASGASFDRLLLELPDPAIAAAVARDRASGAAPVGSGELASKLAAAARAPLVRRWIEQALRSD